MSPLSVAMDKLLLDIETYARAVGRKPQAVLRSAISASWGSWDAWRAGTSSPTVAVADRIYAYMAANPPKAAPPSPEEDAA